MLWYDYNDTKKSCVIGPAVLKIFVLPKIADLQGEIRTF